jgi:hypothetical protein
MKPRQPKQPPRYPANYWGQNWGLFPTPEAAATQVNYVRQHLFNNDPEPADTTMGRRQENFPELPDLRRLHQLFKLDPQPPRPDDAAHGGFRVPSPLVRRIGVRGGGRAHSRPGSLGSGNNPRRWVAVDRNQYDEARLVYALANEVIPAPLDVVEHINGVRADNRPENLVLLVRVPNGTPAPTPKPSYNQEQIEAEMEEWL